MIDRYIVNRRLQPIKHVYDQYAVAPIADERNPQFWRWLAWAGESKRISVLLDRELGRWLEADEQLLG
jgi:hypothetical protein